MNKLYLAAIGLSICCSCNVSNNQSPDFLKISENSTEAFIGHLQGVEKSDSSGPYAIREVYGDTLSFALIFYPTSISKDSVTFEKIKKARENDYHDYLCFAFVYPMKDPTKMKNYHDDNTTYPVTVDSYVRRNKTWEFISKLTVNNLEELSQYEIKCMYSIAH